MPIIKILGEKLETHEQKTFWLDNLTNRIYDTEPETSATHPTVDFAERGKVGPFSRIKIQLGLSCNFSCSYCSQRFVERADETNPSHIAAFLEKLDALPKTASPRFEFWGGEPFVYWKTLKPLAEAVRQRFPDSEFSIVTNGSLLTREKVDWLYDIGFQMAISHDGEGQYIRGADTFADNADAIEYALRRFWPEERISISGMLNKDNRSRLSILHYMQARFPGYKLNLSEMEFVDSYDEGGFESIAFTQADHFQLRRDLWAEYRFNPELQEACYGQSQQIRDMIDANRDDAKAPRYIHQKCGMEMGSTIALDLRGNVLTCQNVSPVALTDEGKSHKIGHVDDLAGVRITSSTHWSARDNCPKCPVMLLCRGACMFLHGQNFEASCAASYSDKIGLFAIAFETITGYVPVWVEGDRLPNERRDVFGSILDWSQAKPARKVIPLVSIN